MFSVREMMKKNTISLICEVDKHTVQPVTFRPLGVSRTKIKSDPEVIM